MSLVEAITFSNRLPRLKVPARLQRWVSPVVLLVLWKLGSWVGIIPKHKWGRDPRFSLSLRPVLADTEEAAWKRAKEIEDRTRELHEKSGQKTTGYAPPNAGAQRLLNAAALGTRVDKRLWTGVAALTGASGDSTGLVGTPEQVADALLDYYDLGVSTFLIRGVDPLEDAIVYGRDVLPLVRERVAARDANPARAAS
jgi:alkanesulfonate monooxygenase